MSDHGGGAVAALGHVAKRSAPSDPITAYEACPVQQSSPLGSVQATSRNETMTRRRLSASSNVLFLLCVMYFITYVDRVNVATAAASFKTEFGLSNTQLGLVFSAFAYPYLVFQIVGGWFADRFGARWTLTVCGVVWAGATVMTGMVGGLVSLFAARLLLGLGEGATFPTATRAMAAWLPAHRAGFAQGITHASARLGNAITPSLVVALIVLISWRGSFVVIGIASLAWAIIWGLYFRDDPKQHPGISSEELAALPAAQGATEKQPTPWWPLCRRMAPVIFVYFCYGWTLWTFLSWIPQYMLHAFNLNLKDSAFFSSAIFAAGVVGDALGGFVSDRVLRRTGDLLRARRDLVIFGMLGSLLSTIPLLFIHEPMVAAVSLASAFFFAEFTIGPMWAIPMDIAPRFSGTASGLMNTGSALAAILSPIVFGAVIDATHNWSLPFYGTIGLMWVGCLAAFWMRPENIFALAPATVTEPVVA
jgi:ACS family glucarate transporter-like MFS transporter